MTRVTTSISAPTARMYWVSPVAMPLSMMSAFRFGRYRVAIAWMSSSTSDQDDLPPVRPQVGPQQADHDSVGSVVHPLTGRTQGAQAGQEAGSSSSDSCSEEACEVVPTHLLHGPEQLRGALRGMDDDQAPVAGVMSADDQVALFHPVDDTRRAGDRDAQRRRRGGPWTSAPPPRAGWPRSAGRCSRRIRARRGASGRGRDP